jgi:transcriptional regulator with XRE-family HTH domain
VLAGKLGKANPFSIECCSGLLGGKRGGHSVHSWASVVICRRYDQAVVLAKGECLRNCASEEDFDVGVGDRLREERTLLGFNQDAFAQLGGITRNTQGSYEKGERNPDSAYLIAVENAGVDVLYVLTGERLKRAAEGLGEAEKQMFDQFRTLSGYDQKAVHRIVNAMSEVTILSNTRKDSSIFTTFVTTDFSFYFSHA